MQPILEISDLIKSYPEKHQKYSYQYLRTIKLKGTLSAKKSAKKLNIKFSRVSDWFYANNKPLPIRTIVKAQKNNWIPLLPSPELAYLVGYNSGDGHISPDLLHLVFTSKYKGILLNIGKEIMALFRIKLNLDKIIYRSNAYHLQISDTALTRMFYAIGTPKGNKTKTKFLVPNWIYKPQKYGCSSELGLKIQKAYLQGLNDAELRTPYENPVHGLSQLNLQMYKTKKLEANHMRFMKQLCKLYEHFNVKTKVKKPKYDAAKVVGEICIFSNLPNLLKFTANVGFRLNSKRLKACKMFIKKSFEVLEKN